jgi:hypothetical protein
MRFKRSERGEGNFGCLVGLILLAIAIFIAYKMIPIKVKNAELRQVVTDEAKAAGTHKDDQIMRAILAKAEENKLPVTEDNVKIHRGSNEITVDVEYVVPVEFPGYTYQWKIRHLAQNPIF